MVKKMTEISKKFSFNGWDIWTFIKGRKKTIITALATILAYWLRPELTSLIVGPIFEGIWATVEFFMKEVELK